MRNRMELDMSDNTGSQISTLEQDATSSGCGDGDSNTLILQSKKRNRNKKSEKPKPKKAPKLSKSQRKKLNFEEKKEKALMLVKSLETLRTYAIPESAFSLLKSSSSIGQAETKKRKHEKMVEFSKAGIEVSENERPFEKRENTDISSESESDLDEFLYSSHDLEESAKVQPIAVERGLAENSSLSVFPSKPPTNEDSPTLDSQFASEFRSEKSNEMDKSIEIPKPEVSYSKPTVVHVSRPDEVEKTRKDLPIIMMEQEIMEAINHNSSVIVCGETGCGKTTQVPQFLYEAGFGSRKNVGRAGIIGVTQPRRVAVLATAKRVAYELGLTLGKEVGFQVRYDKKIGHNSSIKFMTDGILLRELQTDILLKNYSVLILDEAHERSLNTDILIGMLSRVIKQREEIYAEQQKLILSDKIVPKSEEVFPLKLILMSATLRVEDFLSGKRLFHDPPPVMEVPTRQFPVTVHFSKRTEIVDYAGQAYKKVLAIHKRLPPGGILVFVTGQREVKNLCQKLDRASKEMSMKASKEKGESDQIAEAKSISGISMDEINEACDTNDTNEEGDDDFALNEDEFDSYNSESDSDLEYYDDIPNPNSSQEKKLEIGGGNLDVLKAAFEALAGKNESVHVSGSGTLVKKTSDSSPPTLCVHPLYAMLPAELQLRVFDPVKEGERLVVVATNVAETSLTIPGIKYVVDTGREKVKNYDSATGMESYNIQWISKASSAQRAGRAGRTGPGHCYRLYSSAVFNNTFPDFSVPEILKVPVDGVVLLLKSMGFIKVLNFPFPTPPKASALAEAERCLKALEALDSGGNLTKLGKSMARFPMSPRHSRMLLTVIQIMEKKKSEARPNLVLAYAVAAAAALSLSNPLLRQLEQNQPSQDGENHDTRFSEKEDKSRRKNLKETARESRQRFSNPSSDALSVAHALQCFETAAAEYRTQFCADNFLHLKTMEEMCNLRKQLLRIVFGQTVDSDPETGFTWRYGKSEDVEKMWNVFYRKHPLTLYEEDLLGQSICAGWADRVARRVRKLPKSPGHDVNVRSIRYQACPVKETVYLHRWSTISESAPEFLVYSELLESNRAYMHGATRVKPEWLVEYARSLCTFSAPSSDTKPYYDAKTDKVMHYMIPSFGPHLWELAPCGLAITDLDQSILVFGYALLKGQVLPCLRDVRMSAAPETVLKPEGAGQRRVGNLLSKLKAMGIVNCAKLRAGWKENNKQLFSEIKDWFKKGSDLGKFDSFDSLWAKMLSEAGSNS